MSSFCRDAYASIAGGAATTRTVTSYAGPRWFGIKTRGGYCYEHHAQGGEEHSAITHLASYMRSRVIHPLDAVSLSHEVLGRIQRAQYRWMASFDSVKIELRDQPSQSFCYTCLFSMNQSYSRKTAPCFVYSSTKTPIADLHLHSHNALNNSPNVTGYL